jgi:hypothetical protein
MPTNYSLSIIHPTLELLRHAARFLHFMAAAFICLNAVHQFAAHEGNAVLFYTQLIIALDIFILVFFGSGMLSGAAKIGVIFRLIETLTFLGIALTLKGDGHPWLALLHAIAAVVYGFVCYREWQIAGTTAIQLKPTGIVVPHFLAHAEIKWLHIKNVVAGYNSIMIETVMDNKVKFELRDNLKIEELEQINDFCVFHARLSS